MKKKSTYQSAFVNVRVLVGLVVTLAGIFLASVSFGPATIAAETTSAETTPTPARRTLAPERALTETAAKQEAAPQVYVRITSARQRDVVMKFLKDVDPSKYRLDLQEQAADGKMRKSTRGSLPLKDVRQIRGQASSLKGTTETASIIEVLKNFFSVAAVDRLRTALNKADDKPHEVKIVTQ